MVYRITFKDRLLRIYLQADDMDELREVFDKRTAHVPTMNWGDIKTVKPLRQPRYYAKGNRTLCRDGMCYAVFDRPADAKRYADILNKEFDPNTAPLPMENIFAAYNDDKGRTVATISGTGFSSAAQIRKRLSEKAPHIDKLTSTIS